MTPDPLEDYQGPSQAGYFQWQRDEDGQMRPVTRMKNKGECLLMVGNHEGRNGVSHRSCRRNRFLDE